MRYLHPSIGSFAYTTFTDAWFVNSSYAWCETPTGSTTTLGSVSASDAQSSFTVLGGEPLPAAVSAFLDVETNKEWHTSTSATSTVSLTKNGQQLSNTIDFYFYPRPRVFGVSPRIGSVVGGTKLTVTGDNFYKEQAQNTGSCSLSSWSTCLSGFCC